MINKIVIISASGIGNTILFAPTLKLLRAHFPNSIIDLMVVDRAFGECVNGSGLVNNIHVIPDNSIDLIHFLASNRRAYDVSITAFPSNKWQFNAFAFLLGAKVRITHSYVFGKIRTLSFLQNKSVPADPALHDVYQNLNLLKYFSIQTDGEIPKLLFHLSNEHIEFAEQFLRNNRISKDDYIIGVHAGAGPLGDRKKWGICNFAKEINSMTNQNASTVVILFGSVDETEEREQLLRKLNTERAMLFNGTLKQTAALIRSCKYFLSNDTGLMHVAACFGIQQKSIFISTNPIRTSPFNKNAIVQINGDCKQYMYPFWSTK